MRADHFSLYYRKIVRIKSKSILKQQIKMNDIYLKKKKINQILFGRFS